MKSSLQVTNLMLVLLLVSASSSNDNDLNENISGEFELIDHFNVTKIRNIAEQNENFDLEKLNENENEEENKAPEALSLSMNVRQEMQQLSDLNGSQNSIVSSHYVGEQTTKEPLRTDNTGMSNLSALANFKGTVTESFLKKFNPHWLKYPPQSPTAHYILATLYFIMMLFGLTGNLIVIYIYLKSSHVRTPANNLILNLAVSDFLIMLEAPIFIYNALHFGPAAGEFACKMYGMLGATGGTVAINTLAAISIDRYNVIVFPLNPSRSTTNMRSKIMILIVWIVSLPFCVLPFFEVWGVSGYIPEGFLTACSYDYLDTSPANYWFIFIYAIAAYFLPLVIIAYCYFHILHVVLSAKKIQSSKEKNKTEVRLAAVVMGIIGLWLFAWTPYCVVSLVGIFGYGDSISPLASMIPAIMAKTAACADPYLYAVTHPRFRSELEKTFCASRGDQSANFQTSYSRGHSRRHGRDSECETVDIGADNRERTRPPLNHAESSFCEESTVSADANNA